MANPEYSDLYLKSRARMQLEFGQEQIITIPKWLVQWTGDYPSAVLLNQILFHTSRKTDGWFYKSYPEWEEELILKENQVRRCLKTIRELDLGLETKVKKANGAPTTHYKVDPLAFYAAQEQFILSMSEPSKPQIDHVESTGSVSPCDPVESGGSITIEDSTIEKDSSANEIAQVQAHKEIEKPPRRSSKKSPTPPKRNKESHNACLEVISIFSLDFDPTQEKMGKSTASRANKILVGIDDVISDPYLSADEIGSAFFHFRDSSKGGLSYPAGVETVKVMIRQWRDDEKPMYSRDGRPIDRNPNEYAPEIDFEEDERVPAPPMPVGRINADGTPRQLPFHMPQ
jgi:hypothetical protein